MILTATLLPLPTPPPPHNPFPPPTSPYPSQVNERLCNNGALYLQELNSVSSGIQTQDPGPCDLKTRLLTAQPPGHFFRTLKVENMVYHHKAAKWCLEIKWNQERQLSMPINFSLPLSS